MDLSISGLASNFDWKTLVSQLADVERAPQRRLTTEKNQINQRSNAYSTLKTQLGVLQNRINVLKDPAFFDARTATSSNASAATVTVASGSALGSHAFKVTQLATASILQGTSNAGKKLSATSDVSGVNVASAGFPTAVSTGFFTVNGQRINVDSTTTLQAVFEEIASKTGGAVSASYDPSSDTISLTGSQPIVLGAATDTSNFLQAARLASNGTNSVASAHALGAVKLTGPIDQANLGVAATDPGVPAGEFKVNGVTISYDSSKDSVTDILNRINNSEAGVMAGYDPVNDRFTMTNKGTGNVGISVADVSGHLMSAMGLSAGTFSPGKNLLYTVDGGGELSSRTNTITPEGSGVAGVTVNALSESSFTVTVNSDTAKIRSAISDFVTEYNKFQSQLATMSASSTDAQGKVTAGVLAGDGAGSEIATTLRRMMTSDVAGLAGTLTRLDKLGFASNGNDDNLATTDLAGLDKALTSNLAELKDLFTHAESGIATRLDAYMQKTIGADGTLLKSQDEMTRQTQSIDKQIADLERYVVSYQQRLTASFVAMEAAQQKINQQMEFLSKQSFA